LQLRRKRAQLEAPGRVVKVDLAGAVRVQHADVVVVQRAFAGRHGTILFAALVLACGRAVSTDGIADALWGDHVPPTWQSMVRNALTRVRRAVAPLGPASGVTLVGERGGHRLLLPPGADVDLHAARRAVDDAEACLLVDDARQALTCASWVPDALHQPLLAGFDSMWLDRQRDLADQLRIRALETVAEAHLRLGDTGSCIDAADRLMELAPLREDGYRLAMQAHAECGRRGAALQVYARCRRTLGEELGCPPDPATERVRSALLDQAHAHGIDAQRGQPAA
jgi:DNA-binding SARP family transcriptional activator